MKPFITILIALAVNCISAYGRQQQSTTDSLRQVVTSSLKQATKPDTLLISQINRLAAEYFEAQPDSTQYFGQLQIQLSQKINYKKGIANGNVHLADVHTLRGNYTAATKLYNTALAIYKQLNHLPGTGRCYMELGYIQDHLGHYDSALALYNKALAITIKTRDETNEAETYNLMGMTFDNKGDLSKALDYYFKALFIDIKLKDDLSAASKYNNIGLIMQRLELYPKALNYYERAESIWRRNNDQLGLSNVYQNIGETYMGQHSYTKAIPYLRQARAMFIKQQDSDGICLINYDLGLYHHHLKHADSALYYFNLSAAMAQQNNVEQNKANAYIGLAMVYNQQQQYQQAYNYAQQALTIGQKLNSLSVRTDAALQVGKALGGLKRFEEAYNMHLQHSALKADLKHNEGIHKIMLYHIEVDFANKQRELAEKRRLQERNYQAEIASQRHQILIYVALIIILAALALIYYNAKTEQQRVNRLLAEKNRDVIQHQDELNMQTRKLNELNTLKDRLISVLAHDLRAPISTLRGLFNLMNDDTISAEEFMAMSPKVFNRLEHTSDFLDTLLFWINSQVDTTVDRRARFEIGELLAREVEHLDDKLKQKNISINTNISDDAVAWADPSCVRIVMHNFLTNAIKFSNRDSNIEINAHRINADTVKFCLTDHGIGMSPEHLNNLFKSHVTSQTGTENEIGTGMGMMFCKDLIEQQNGKIWAQSELGKGTKLCFTIPAAA